MIKIFGYNNVTSEDSTSQSDTDTSQVSSSESTAENQDYKNELSGFSVSVDSDKQLTIKLSESDSKYWGYMVAVHSSATKSNNYAEGWVFETTTEELVTYSAELSGEYTAGTENPVITVELENASAADSITPEMTELTGLFEPLEITSVTGSGNTVTITTEGVVDCKSPFTAGVKLSAGATSAGSELYADCDIKLCRSIHCSKQLCIFRRRAELYSESV